MKKCNCFTLFLKLLIVILILINSYFKEFDTGMEEYLDSNPSCVHVD